MFLDAEQKHTNNMQKLQKMREEEVNLKENTYKLMNFIERCLL